MAALNEEFCVFAVEGAALGLHIGADGAADIRALVVVEVTFLERLVDHVHRALDQAALVGVLDAQQELAVRVARDEIGIERRAQIAHVHVSRGGGCKARAHLAVRDARFHFIKPFLIDHIVPP